MKNTPTCRGFARYNFQDGNGVACSIQKSSVATEDMIWLGCNEIGLKRFTPGTGWEDIELQDDAPHGVTHIANTRMHLTQEQAEKLIPLLQKFVETGEI